MAANFSDIKKRLILERLVIGVEEPILVKGGGEFTAKVDSGNSGLNVIHGEDLYANGDVLVFVTFDKDGNERRISKKIQKYVDVNIGGGVVEHRPVVHLDIKFADEDYKSVPFSVTNRSKQKNKVLICKDFVSKELDALIDPGASNIAAKGVEAELTEESVELNEGKVGKKVGNGAKKLGKGAVNLGWKGLKAGAKGVASVAGGAVGGAFNLATGLPDAIKRTDNMLQGLAKGEKGALTGYAGNEVKQFTKAALKPTATTWNFLSKGGKPVTNIYNTVEYEDFKRNEAEKKDIQEKVDPAGARMTAESENIAELSGVQGATVDNSAICAVMDYDGYIGSSKKPIASQKSFHDKVKDYLASRESITSQRKAQNESFVTEASVEEQPQPETQEQEQPIEPDQQEVELFSPFRRRNYFRFNFMSFLEGDEQPKNVSKEFNAFMKKHQGQIEAYANQFFSSLGSGDFDAKSAASVSFIHNVKTLMESTTNLKGIFFVAQGDGQKREYSFYKQKNLIITPDAQDSRKEIQKLVRSYNQLKNAWINDEYLKLLPIRPVYYPDAEWIDVIKKDYRRAVTRVHKNILHSDVYDSAYNKGVKPSEETYKTLKALVDFFGDYSKENFAELPPERQKIYLAAKKNFAPYTPDMSKWKIEKELRKDYQDIFDKWVNHPLLKYFNLGAQSDHVLEVLEDLFRESPSKQLAEINKYLEEMIGVEESGLREKDLHTAKQIVDDALAFFDLYSKELWGEHKDLYKKLLPSHEVEQKQKKRSFGQDMSEFDNNFS